MLITDKEKLKKYSSGNRLWQGVPGIEVTKKGRIFLTFYSGGTTEEIGNYALIIKSDDGKNFSEPIAAVYKEEHRCYDPCLWIDPLDRLWFIWSYAPDHAVYASICNEPDAEELVWGEAFKIGNDVMMNKPTVLTTGEWLFPITVWGEGVRTIESKYDSLDNDKRAFAYKTTDNGKTFEKIGGTAIPQRSYDEHMFLELPHGKIAMFVRTSYGIGVSYSVDGGKNWSDGIDSGLGGPNSRFFIRRLKSGRVLLINHYNYTGRSHLTAMLSEDDGRTYPYKLLLDERQDVSYPDAVEADDGYIYIVYDRDRGTLKKSFEEVYSAAREVLIAKITEQDILNGNISSSRSVLKQIASKLHKYEGGDNPYNQI